MTNPVTPNIGLNKIDRTSPSTTYFDLEKYIDQNADAVDRFAGETSASIDALEKRLDTEERREVVLQPGLQIVNTERSAPFKLSGIKGRTLVNLLGRDGDFETIIPTVLNASTISALDNTSMYSGSNSIKVTATGSETVEHYADMTAGYKAKQGSYYVLIGMLKVNKGAAQIKIYNNKPQLSPEFFISESNIVSQTGTFSLVRTAFNPIVDCDVIPRLYLLKDPSTSLYVQNGESANFDCIRMFEVSKQEYDSFGSLTFEQIAAKYPYVDSVQPVRNPYAIRYGENLLPPFYEWALHSTAIIVDAYTLLQTATGSTQNTSVRIPIRAGETYTLSYLPTEDSNVAYINIQWLDANGGSLGYTPKNTSGQTVIAPDRAVIAHVLTGNTTAGTFTFKNPMLTLGSQAKPFKLREDSMLALQTDLYADPLAGANADEVFEKDGQYFKLSNWRHIVLDDSVNWTSISSHIGFKALGVVGLANSTNFNSLLVTKYDGKILSSVGNFTSYDQTYLSIASNYEDFFLTVSSTDSGWGDNYTPTADEIKAYFVGWKMYDATGNASSVYNGTGGKAWVNLAKYKKGDNSDWSVTLPRARAKGYTEYQLVYQLATPMIEPIVSEGMLAFNEGNNQIEVGAGVVLREKAKPVLNGPHYNVNNTNYPLSLLDNKTERIIRFYKNNADDPWCKFTNLAYGNEGLYTLAANFDPSATYSVTYLMLDKSPIVPFTGSYASNEKAMLEELKEAVQQNATSVSVLMNKKVEKNVPVVQIKPTLLNGWVEYLSGYHHVRYYEDSSGIVHLTGLVKTGAINTEMFKLAEGYRPVATIVFAQQASTGSTARLDIFPGGGVYFNYAASWNADSWVSLDGISFVAEQ